MSVRRTLFVAVRKRFIREPYGSRIVWSGMQPELQHELHFCLNACCTCTWQSIPGASSRATCHPSTSKPPSTLEKRLAANILPYCQYRHALLSLCLVQVRSNPNLLCRFFVFNSLDKCILIVRNIIIKQAQTVFFSMRSKCK